MVMALPVRLEHVNLCASYQLKTTALQLHVVWQSKYHTQLSVECSWAANFHFDE